MIVRILTTIEVDGKLKTKTLTVNSNDDIGIFADVENEDTEYDFMLKCVSAFQEIN